MTPVNKEKIGKEESECLSCKLCEEGCPTQVKLDRVVRLQRYLRGARGSHGSMFLTLNQLAGDSNWNYTEGQTDQDSEVVFFPGCTPLYDTTFDVVGEQPYGDYSAMGRDRKYSNMGLAALKLLNQMGVEPRLVTACCGHDLYYAGRLDEFEQTRQELTEKIGDARVIVTACAECRHALSDVYGLPAVHIAEYAMEHIDDLELEDTGLRVMYHDPCRLGRYAGVYDQPRELIGRVADLVEFRENREDAHCCGVSSWMNCTRATKEERERKINEYEESGADYLVVGCPKCAMHLDCLYYEEGEDARKRDKPNIIDLSELLALATGAYSLDDIPAKHYESTGEPMGPITPRTVERDPTRYIDDDLTETLFNCSTCFYCTSTCPTSHETPHLIEDLRRYFVEQGLNPERHQGMHENILETGNPYGETEEICDEQDDAELLYFPGCTAKYRMTGIYDSTRDLLRAMDITYSVPEGLECCGSPLLRTGYDADKVQEANQVRLDSKKVVASCAGCHATLLNDYEGVEVQHLVEVLAERIDDLPLKELSMRVSYHDPCHLGREFGMYDAPRQVIKAIPGVELVEFEENRENSRCCGGGGGLRAWNPEKAAELARERMSEAEETGVDAVVSTCPFCKLNLASVSDTEVLDLGELVQRAME